MPTFSRQHYQRIANIIRESDKDTYPIHNPHSVSLDKLHLFEEFVKMFQEDNPLFDKAKFAEACGI